MSKKSRRKKASKPTAQDDVQVNEVIEEQSNTPEPSGDDVVDASGDSVDGTDGADAAATASFLDSPFMSAIMNVYELVVYSVGGGLCVAMFSVWFKANATVQWILGITAMIAIFLSKTVFAGELGDIYEEAQEKVAEDRLRDQEELANGNFDGVPKIMQDLLKYPTEEDYQKIYDEADRQRGILKEWENGRNGHDGKGDKSGKSE